jgi:hypothetical protein
MGQNALAFLSDNVTDENEKKKFYNIDLSLIEFQHKLRSRLHRRILFVQVTFLNNKLERLSMSDTSILEVDI